MIDKLFTFNVCDEVDQLLSIYEKVKLACSIGKHAPDTEFDWARIDYDEGILTLAQTIGLHHIEYRYPLALQVGELIQEPTP